MAGAGGNRTLRLCGSGGEGGKFGMKTFGPPPWFK